MANLCEAKGVCRTFSTPLFISESNDDRQSNKRLRATASSFDEGDLDSTCITPILNAYSSRASQLSDSSTTPTNSYTTAYLTPRSSYSSVTLSDSTSAEFYSIAPDLDDSNEKTISSIYDTCIEAGSRLKSAVQSSRLLSATRSVQQRLRPLRSYGRLLNNRFMKLQQLSIVRGTQIDIQGDQADEKKDCTCEGGHFDGNCLKSFMMSVQAPEYRSTPQMMASNPVVAKDVYDHNIFNVARIKKVELHELAPKVPEFHDASLKDRCINNNNVRTPNGNHYSNQPNIFVTNIAATAPINTKGQHQSNAVTMPAPEDGSVLKKVISFTFDQTNNVDCMTEKATRPSFVPEKLHFSAYEQFKGQLFVKWVSSTISQTAEFSKVDSNTIETIISNVCTHLVAAGVLKQIIDNGEKTTDVFCPNEMYQWTHIELSRQQQNGPKKECMENLQKQNDKEFSEYESNSTTMTVTSNGCEESFAFIKNKLYSSEVNGKFEFAAGETITVDDGHMEDCVNKESFQSTIADKNGHSKYDQFIQRNCDSKIVRSFVETSTQTENNLESVPLKKSPATLSAAPSMLTPPPPPPPPPPLPFIFTNSPDDNTVNDKSSANESSLQQTSHQISHNTSQNVPATTILSSASSFCIPPPPPINGIPGPPPLPLPTGNMWFKSDTLRKAAKHPPKPMINLFWTRILIPKEEEEEVKEIKTESESESNTLTVKRREKLWQKIDETILENADDFTELFARQATPKRPREATKLPKKTVIKVLEHKRSQSVGIFSQSLYRHRIDSTAIQRAIYNWDLSSIGLDLLQQLLEHRATENELKLIKDAFASAAPGIPLDGPENFLLKFSEISCAPERIACIIFRNDFEEANAQIEHKMKIVRSLCEFLVDNDNLSDLFAIILTLGNFMNGGNRYRGQADGFGLDVLNKLKDVKSKDKKITLLHFIIKTFINKRRQSGFKLKEIIYPVPDADDVKNATTIDFIVLKEQIEQLRKNLEEIEQKIQIVIDSSTEQNVEPFKTISQGFVQSACNKIDFQFRQLEECKVIFRDTLDYFKHIPKTGTIDECTPSQFFELWSNFSVDFRDLWKKELAAINAEILQKYKSIASPKTPLNRNKGKPKSSGLRVRRLNQI